MESIIQILAATTSSASINTTLNEEYPAPKPQHQCFQLWSRAKTHLNHTLSRPKWRTPQWEDITLSFISAPKFPSFMSLSFELRRQVWHFAAPPPSVIRTSGYDDDVKRSFYKRSGRAVPALLHVCREARYEFLYREDIVQNNSTYRICRMGLWSCSKANYLYLSHEIDTVLFSTHIIFNGLEPKELLDIRHLAILKSKEAWHRATEIKLLNHLTWFRKLETLTIVRKDLQPMLPEEKGEVNLAGLGDECAWGVMLDLEEYKRRVWRIKRKHPMWKEPKVRVRCLKQMEGQ